MYIRKAANIRILHFSYVYTTYAVNELVSF